MGRQREKREDTVCEIKRESIREAPNADVRRFIDPKHAVLRVLVDAYGYGRLAVPNLGFSLLSAFVNFSSSGKKSKKKKKREKKDPFRFIVPRPLFLRSTGNTRNSRKLSNREIKPEFHSPLDFIDLLNEIQLEVLIDFETTTSFESYGLEMVE